MRRLWRRLCRWWQESVRAETAGPSPLMALAVGSWRCSCGLFEVVGLRSEAVSSVRVFCPHCHEAAEVLALPA